METGEKFRAVRKEKALSAEAFGGPIGIKKSHISAIENGKSQPSEAVIKLMIQHYNVSKKWWETGEGEIFVEETEKPQTPEHLRLLHKEIDKVLGEKSLAEQYAMVSEVLKLLQKKD